MRDRSDDSTHQPPNAFDRDFLDTFLRRDPAPATPELHLLHDGYPVGTAERESDQLPLILTALADLRTQPEALAHFLLAVPDEVLRRCGVILAQMAGEEAG